MNKERKNEIKVGIVSILAILLMIAGITIGRGYRVSVSAQTIKFRFPNSGGIQISSPVVVNGVKRGSVSSVKNNNGTVLIEATIDETSDFKSDANARITVLEITGGKKIEINPGTTNYGFDPNKEIPGVTAYDLSELVSEVGEMALDGKKLIRRLDTISANITKLLENGKLTRQLTQIVENTDQLITVTKEFFINNKDELNSSVKNLNIIAADVKTLIKKDGPKLDSLLSNLDETLKSAKAIVIKADGSLSNVDAILADVKNITNEIKSGEGFVNKLLYDKNTTAKLDSTFNNLTELINLIRQHGVNVNVRLGTRP